MANGYIIEVVFSICLFWTAACNHHNNVTGYLKCKYGKYVKDIGQKPSCNPNAQVACPKDFTCSSTGEKLGYCCLKENPCGFRQPFKVNGEAVHCSGDGATQCIKGYQCFNPTGDFSVCCRNNECPHGVKIVKCITDPCLVTSCPQYPSATCTPDYCGKCTARFYTEGKKEVTNKCHK